MVKRSRHDRVGSAGCIGVYIYVLHVLCTLRQDDNKHGEQRCVSILL